MLILFTFEQEVVFKLQHLKSSHAGSCTHRRYMRCMMPHLLDIVTQSGSHHLQFISEVLASEWVSGGKKLDSNPLALRVSSPVYTFALQNAVFLLSN